MHNRPCPLLITCHNRQIYSLLYRIFVKKEDIAQSTPGQGNAAINVPSDVKVTEVSLNFINY